MAARIASRRASTASAPSAAISLQRTNSAMVSPFAAAIRSRFRRIAEGEGIVLRRAGLAERLALAHDKTAADREPCFLRDHRPARLERGEYQRVRMVLRRRDIVEDDVARRVESDAPASGERQHMRLVAPRGR